ncbi:two-component system response regulator YesN [Fontibacillus solani]|uniref:Two-component system response regulator YesN n=1 Tax=Fontibacillus solani TaxID=1572857 RepID=A0A7W3SVN2_9BACL|nr:response regulator [Fontibacillus solani]MBA9087106.1 two-component system response regulator YesN [Fontibacillus solani]
MYRVMIVDDEPLFRDYLRMKMDWDGYGFKVSCEARNGKEALEEAQKYLPHLSLIDINMPFMSGLDLAEQLKVRFPDMIIVFVTGHNEFDYVRQAVRLGVNDYLLKPFDREELAAMLERIRPALPEQRDKKREDEEIRSNAPQLKGAADVHESIMMSLRFRDPNLPDEVKNSVRRLQAYEVDSEYASTMLMGLVSVGLSFAAERGVPAENLCGNRPEQSLGTMIRGLSTWDETEAWMVSFFAKLVKLTADPLPSKSYKLFLATKAYIERHYHEEDLSVEDVAAAVFVDSSYLRRVFRKESGYSVLDHIVHTRMKKAKELLQDGNLKLATVAEAVGFSDPSYFSKCFKKKFGMTPTEFEQLKYSH